MHHRRLGLITLLIFLLGIFLFYFFGWASFLETKEAHKKWQDANKEKENMVELVGLTPQLSVQFQKFTESVVPLLQATPRSLQASDYISLLSSLARQSGNVLTRVKVAKPDTSGDVAIEIGFAGTLTTLEKMLQKIERTLPLLEVAHFQSKGGSDLQDFSLKLTIHTFPDAALDDSMSIQNRLAALKRALVTRTDILNDDTFKTLKTGEGFPSPVPSQDEVGRADPFAPL